MLAAWRHILKKSPRYRPPVEILQVSVPVVFEVLGEDRVVASGLAVVCVGER